MQLRSRAASGTRARASAGISAPKHQHVLAPAARPQPFGPPQSGQTSGGTLSSLAAVSEPDTRAV